MFFFTSYGCVKDRINNKLDVIFNIIVIYTAKIQFEIKCIYSFWFSLAKNTTTLLLLVVEMAVTHLYKYRCFTIFSTKITWIIIITGSSKSREATPAKQNLRNPSKNHHSEMDRPKVAYGLMSGLMTLRYRGISINSGAKNAHKNYFRAWILIQQRNSTRRV